MSAPTRPALRYHGGKWKLAPWIIEHFPPHRVYVEPFGGAASVLLRKEPARTEIYNDLYGEVVSLFRVLRDPVMRDALCEAIALTPYAREEYHTLYEAWGSPVERARRFVARSYMGMSSKGAERKSGFDCRINADAFVSRLNAFRSMPEALAQIAQRMAQVVIEQRPAFEVLAAYDREDCLFFVDPPYMADSNQVYTYRFGESDHVDLLERLFTLKGMVVLCGYPSALYDDGLPGWTRFEIEAHADGAHPRTEALWINSAAMARLTRQPLLF